MKCKLCAFITLICIFAICFTSTASAAFGVFKNDPVIDGALILTEEEKQDISSKLSSIRDKYGVDVAIYTDFTMPYNDVECAANNRYDSLNYGSGDDNSGILFYVSAYPREYYLLSNGSCYKTKINDRGLVYIEKMVLPHLQNKDYYEAFMQFAESSEKLLEKAANGRMYNTPPLKEIGVTILLVIGIPLLLAIALTYGRILKMNTAVKATFANNYIKNNGLNLTDSRDIFLYSTTTKTHRNTSSSSGRSSGGRSRSGGSRGGRGGKY